MRRPAFLLLVCASVLCALDNVELKWKFEKGTSRVLTTESVMEQSMEIRGRHTASKMTASGEVRWSITESSADSSTVEMTYLGQKMKIEGDQGVKEYDSTQDKDAVDPRFAAFAKLASKSIKLTLSSAGKVTGVQGFEELLGDLPDREKMVESLVNPIVQQAYPQLPDHAVTKGDTWTQETKTPIPNLGAMVMKTTYTYDSTEEFNGEKCARVGVAYDFSMDSTGGKMPSKIEMGKQSGLMRIALDRGVLVSTESELEFTMTAGDPKAPVLVQKSHQVTWSAEKEHSK